MPLPVTYRLLALEFRNGRPENDRMLGFRRARLIHDKELKRVLIEKVDTPDGQREKILAGLAPFPIWTLRYEILAGNYPAVSFCHPFPRGFRVMLYEFVNPTAAQRNCLYLQQEDSRQFFSDAFTLSGVTNNLVPSNQPAFQFDE